MTTQSLAPASIESSPLQSVVDRILRSRQITRLDQCLLLAVSDTTADDQRLINQVFDRLRQGRLRVVE